MESFSGIKQEGKKKERDGKLSKVSEVRIDIRREKG